MNGTRMEALDRDTQGRRALERRMIAEPAASLADDLHRDMGERLTAGLMGILDFLAGLRQSSVGADNQLVVAQIQATVTEQLEQIRTEVAQLRSLMEEVRAGIQRIDRFTMQRMLGLYDSAEPEPARSAPVMREEELEPSRAPRAQVVERVLSAARRLQDSGKDISLMTATALAKEAGVKPAQFTYAFKNRDTFFRQYQQWLAEQQPA